jgi:antitoxin (DNA-binding transcriptional repressor) of toxin-antitoxin stability system
MKTASVTESKNELSRLLRSVRAGKSILIMDRDVPVARLEPVAGGTLPDEPRLAALERQGLLRRNRQTGGVIARLKQLPAPKVKTGASAVAVLLAEREEAGR